MSVSVPKDKDLRYLIQEPLPYQRGRKIQWIPKTDAGLRSRVMKHRVNPSTRRPIKKPLLVIGTGRCGTTWLSETLMKAGYDVPHEYVGEHGTVSMFFQALSAGWYPYIPWSPGEQGRVAHVGERRDDFKFQCTVHLVRHPLHTVASMASIITELTKSWFYEQGITKTHWKERPALIRDLKIWRDSVRMCEAQADMTFNLYQFDECDWADMIDFAGLNWEPMPHLPPKNKSSGFKKHEPPTWPEIRKLDPELCDELQEMCEELDLWLGNETL